MESLSLFSAVVKHLDEGIMITDADLEYGPTILYVNPAMCRITGYSEKELLQKSPTMLYGPATSPQVLREIVSSLRSGESFSGQAVNYRKDGSPYYLDWQVNPIYDASGEITRFLSVQRDITEETKNREELLISRSNLSAILENTQEPIWSVDRNYQLLFFNSAFKERVKHFLKIVISDGMSIEERHPTLETAEAWRQLYDRALIGERFTERFSVVNSDDRPYEFSFNPIYSNGEITGVSVFGKDVSERLEFEQQLLEAKEKAEEMNRLKTSFLANMSHEIRTPMTAILGYASLIKESSDDVEINYFAQTIERAGSRLLETINGILDLAKIEANKIELEPQLVSVAAEIDRVIKLLYPIAEQHGLQLIVEHVSGPLITQIDPQFFNRILTNLIGNAIKFTEHGRIIVESDVLYNEAGSWFVVRITDTGIGISEEFLPHVFEEFKQESGGFHRKYEGTGLGLTISKRLAELMGGRLTVESLVGKGSVFSIVLPYEDVPADKIASLTFDGIQGFEKDNEHPLSILLIEDSIEAAELIKQYCRDLHSLDHAMSAVQALQHLHKKKYDILIVDINLGEGMSGLNLVRMLRANPAYEDTMIIAITAYAMKGDKETILQAGFSEYLSKPFTRAQLLTVIRDLLQKRGMQSVS